MATIGKLHSFSVSMRALEVFQMLPVTMHQLWAFGTRKEFAPNCIEHIKHAHFIYFVQEEGNLTEHFTMF